jgi:GNAT superfamily N-acetyltransferase
MIEGPRAATAGELPSVVELANAVFGKPGTKEMGKLFPLFFHVDNLANLRILLDGGRPVSLVGMAFYDVELGGARVRTACIGSVCTLEAYRGQGLAARLVDDAFALARSRSAPLTLISGGRGLYRRIGCIDAGLFRVVTVDARSRLPRMKIEARPWSPADIGALSSLQRSERIRWMRSDRETRIFLETGRVHAWPAQVWVVHAGGKPVAWLAASEPDGSEGERILRVREIAGSRLAVLAALPAVLRATKLPVARVDAQASDVELEMLASAFGLRSEAHGFSGTVRILDPDGLLRSLEGWFAERLERSERESLSIEPGDRTTFRSCGQSFVVETLEDLAALVFGSVERTPPRPPAGPLADLLARIFPVPLPCYGLNYT